MMGLENNPIPLAPMATQGFNYGQVIPAVPPWTWQPTSQPTAAQTYYHPLLSTNAGQGMYPAQGGMPHTPSIRGVQMAGPSRNMVWNYNKNDHQYADVVIRGSKLELPLFSGDEPIGWLEQCEKFFRWMELRESNG